jgi:hypothetical protein
LLSVLVSSAGNIAVKSKTPRRPSSNDSLGGQINTPLSNQ